MRRENDSFDRELISLEHEDPHDLRRRIARANNSPSPSKESDDGTLSSPRSVGSYRDSFEVPNFFVSHAGKGVPDSGTQHEH